MTGTPGGQTRQEISATSPDVCSTTASTAAVLQCTQPLGTAEMNYLKPSGAAIFFLLFSCGANCETQLEPSAPAVESEAGLKIPIDGIDVSRYQGEFVSFADAERNKVRFVFVKATQGSRLVDKYYLNHVAQAKAAQIPFGVYHFYDPRTSHEEQFQNFTRTVSSADIDLPPVVDIEEEPPGSLPNWKTELSLFLKGIEEKYKVVPIIYTGETFAKRHFARSDIEFTRYPLWLARYPTNNPVAPGTMESPPKPVEPWARWHFWQYTEECRVAGVVGLADCNRFFGNLEQFEALRVNRK